MRVFSIEDALHRMLSTLIGEVTPELRAVAIDLDQNKKVLQIHFYYDGETSKKQIDTWNYLIMEGSSFLRIQYRLESQIEQLNYPMPIPFHPYFAYLKKEDSGILHKNNLSCKVQIKTGFIRPALLATQNALLGIVAPELRAVVVDFDEKKSFLYLRFYHDKDIPQNLLDLWQTAMKTIKKDFAPDYLLDGKVERVDYPGTFPFRGRYAYFRKELPLESHSLET